MADAARLVIPEPAPQAPRPIQPELPPVPPAPAATRSSGRRAIRWIAAGLAVIAIAGLAFAYFQEAGKLADTREELAAKKATIGGLQTQVDGLEKKVADVTETKDNLSSDVASLESDLDTCRNAVQASQAFSKQVREMIGAILIGDRSGFLSALRQTSSLQRKADGANTSCIRATEGATAL